jgi:uncharacterized protein
MNVPARILTATRGTNRRSVSAELRADATAEFVIVGYAAMYDSWSQDLGGFIERLKPGCFDAAMKRSDFDCKCLFNHDPSKVLGRTKSGTLSVTTDDKGLKFRCQLDRNNTDHANIWSAMKRGDVSQCSFSFTTSSDGAQSWAEGGIDPDTGIPFLLRTIHRVDELLDCSVVTYPAYVETSASARSKDRRSAPDYGGRGPSAHSVATFRKLAQINLRKMAGLLRQADPNGVSAEDFASIGGHLQRAHESAELACSYVGDALDMLGDDSDEEMCSAIRSAHGSLNEACDKFAAARLRHAAHTVKVAK